MKYKIIPEDVIKNLIDFLDEIQFMHPEKTIQNVSKEKLI